MGGAGGGAVGGYQALRRERVDDQLVSSRFQADFFTMSLEKKDSPG